MKSFAVLSFKSFRWIFSTLFFNLNAQCGNWIEYGMSYLVLEILMVKCLRLSVLDKNCSRRHLVIFLFFFFFFLLSSENRL